MAEVNIRCPKCGSKDVDRHWGDKLIKGGAEIVGGFLEGYFFGGSGETGGKIAGGLADEISQKYECNHCGHTFTKGAANKNSSNSKSSSNKKNSNSGNSNNSGPFNSSYQNALYNELRSLSSDKGGFTNVDYSLIVNLGNSYGLSKEQIYDVAMKCMWKNGVKPSMTGLFGNNSTPNMSSSNKNNNQNPSKNFKKFRKDFHTLWYHLKDTEVVARGLGEGLTEDEIYSLIKGRATRENVRIPTRQELFRSTSNQSYTNQKKNSSMGGSMNSPQDSFFSSNGQNALYQELYSLSSDKGGFSQADFDLVVKIGKSYNLTQDEIFQVAQKCLWKSWITLTKDQLFKSTLEKSESAQSISNKELDKKSEVSDNEKEYIDELKSIYLEQSEISERERRLLNRLSKSLGISEERAKELENQVNPNTLSDKEQEYAEEIKACLEDDGVISDRERRILNRLATSLDISTERAEEIEKIIISRNK